MKREDRVPAWYPWLWYLALLAAALLVYQPVWHGGLLWDDEAHVIQESLRTWSGLGRLWTDFRASQQYYPVAGTAFWIMAQLWGDNTLGYHIVNIVLHASSAFLVTIMLRRWRVPGALLAGAVFALHPVYVESVAWIAELKNTLSGTCYLGAMMCYLRFDATRAARSYAAALVLFALALGSKTVTATLPAALLVIFWWQRGRITWKRDALPLVPFFALGIGAGLGTAWIEYHWVGAQGSRFDLTMLGRVLLAGRIVWFYIASLVWPVNLSFNYPRWTVDTSVWWQYLFTLAAAAVLGVVFVLRNRTRGPLAAALFFIGTLFPAIGFMNVYPFRFSYVADHFQYLASLSIVAALCAAITMGLERWRRTVSPLLTAVVIAIPLSVATFQYSHLYADADTLYRETIARNPNSTLARGNLAARLFEGPPSGWPEAMDHARSILAVDPESVAGHNLLGVGYQREGRLEESLRELRRAVALDPGLAEAKFNLGLTLDGLGRLDEAVDAYQQSLEIYPKNVRAMHNLANVLRRLGRYNEALVRLRTAIAIDPDSADVRLNYADTLQASGDTSSAIAAYQDALGRRPDWGEAWNNLGSALRRQGRFDEARQAFERAAALMPNAPLIQVNLATLYVTIDQPDKAVDYYERALSNLPDGPQTAKIHADIAAVLMKLGRKAEAQAHLEAAKRIR